MWNPFEQRRLSRDWRLVNTLEAQFVWQNPDGKTSGDKSELFYYLYENGLGERKCETAASDHKGGVQVRQHPYYLRKVRPWLAGQFDPEIPNYESIKTKEFKDALAGKVT